MTASPKIFEKSIVVLQLERKYRVVKQLQQKLNSYLCAPTTYQLFEKKEDLKTGLEHFTNSAEELLATLKLNGIKVMNYIDDIEQRFEEYNALNKEMDAYVQIVRH